MKKIICLLLTITFLFTSAETAFAKKDHAGGNDKHHTTHQHNNHEDKKQEFKINGSPVIKYGRYKLPIMPITKGMGATVTFDKECGVLTVVKDTIEIIINFKQKTVTVNGVADKNTGIFTAKNDKKMTVLIKYIASILGVNVTVDHDKVTVEESILALPTNITISPVGTTVIANTLNSTSLYMTATAKITANQAVGGRAELYVGSKLVATDIAIAAADTTVTFTTADSNPTNAELQSLIPSGGVVTVKLYNASNTVVTSRVANPTLIVDYVAPTITGITSAFYNAAGNQINLTVTGAGAIGDLVDVTKLSLFDYTLGKTYQLTETGSKGVVKSATSVVITIGAVDKYGLTGFGNTTGTLMVAIGSLLKDTAGNTSPAFLAYQNIPFTVSSILDPPTNVTVTPIGTSVVANTLNSTTYNIVGTANIIAGQATGGKAELYVGNKLVATDAVITATDTSVNFTTSDNTPTNAEMQLAIPAGGLVTVKLYNAANNSVSSAVGNPMLIVDYIAPTITGVTSAVYNVTGNQLYLYVTGAGSIGDTVDVTKIAIYCPAFERTYQLTNTSTTGSYGVVGSTNSLIINIGTFDKIGLTGFGSYSIYLTIYLGPLLKDAAGNTSPGFTSILTVPVTVMN